MQIFDVLRRIGGYHSFSAGLVIGGKNLKDERDRLSRMNILVATPGRLLQHMDQTVGFDCQNLQMLGELVSMPIISYRCSLFLVLDEADRILDMGFARSLNAIISHLPRDRQTLLFSATQTQSVKDLARLSLDKPTSVNVQEVGSGAATPRNLEQHYLVCELERKLDVLYSFIKSHLKTKAIVFMSSGKQVYTPSCHFVTVFFFELGGRFDSSLKHSASFNLVLHFSISTENKSRQSALQYTNVSSHVPIRCSLLQILPHVGSTFLRLTGLFSWTHRKIQIHTYIV